MAIREILEVPDPRLKTVSKPVEVFDEELKALAADMYETMYAANGIGLAAIQVGEPIRLLVIDLQPHEVELFREKLNHRWMGFSREALSGWLAAAGFGGVRWHPLSPRQARAKDGGGGMAVPDLFVLRAEAGVEALRH